MSDIDYNEVLPGIKDILREEGLDMNLRVAPDPEAYYSYFINEFIPNAPHSEELMQIFIDAGFSIMNFIILLWARRNPHEHFAKLLEKKFRYMKGH